jgi:hypothetical protein
MPRFRGPKKVIGALPPPARTPADIPAAARPRLEAGERILAVAQEDAGGHWLVLTSYRLLERTPDGDTALERPWHEVDAGAWNPDLWVLATSFVDGLGGRQWQLKTQTGPGQVPQVFRERTQASVVLTRSVDLGARRTARVSVRKVLDSRELVEQVLWGRGTRRDDEELARRVRAARFEVRDQVGLPPEPPD